jgi:hypothetical protein
MAEVVDNLVLEQLRLIRETLGSMQGEIAELRVEMRSEIADVKGELLGQRSILVDWEHTSGRSTSPSSTSKSSWT